MDTAELTALARRYRKAEAALDTARAQLQEAAVKAMDEGVKQTEVAQITGWTREHLRKLKRSAEESG
jgi:hypothetical protein